MRLAIMQPYFFPYLGYFQLINSVDKFVIYDDVNYIKQGWINRNYVVVQGEKSLITLPLTSITSFSKINSIMIDPIRFQRFKTKFFKMLSYEYTKAQYYKPTIALLEEIFDFNPQNCSIANFNQSSITKICSAIGIHTTFVQSSLVYENTYLTGQARVIDICKRNMATVYINSIGGKELYGKLEFKRYNIELLFLVPKFHIYPQAGNQFIPGLSIIDIMMHNSLEMIQPLLNNYELT